MHLRIAAVTVFFLASHVRRMLNKAFPESNYMMLPRRSISLDELSQRLQSVQLQSLLRLSQKICDIFCYQAVRASVSKAQALLEEGRSSLQGIIIQALHMTVTEITLRKQCKAYDYWHIQCETPLGKRSAHSRLHLTATPAATLQAAPPVISCSFSNISRGVDILLGSSYAFPNQQTVNKEVLLAHLKAVAIHGGCSYLL